MPRTALAAIALAASLAAAAPSPAAAQTVHEGVFDFTLRGLRAGTLQFRAVEERRGYAVSGRLESAGILAAVRRVRFEGRAEGQLSGDRLMPRRYEEDADTGKRQSRAVMVWQRGVPQVESVVPARAAEPHDLDPRTQGGTVDPLTALFATLRDVPADRACTTSVTMFDGRRRSQLRLSAAEPTGDGGIRCSGEYRRVAGFTPSDMAEKTRFPFTLTYAPAGEGWVRVVEVAMDTLYGRAALKRR
jgi:hypothetical protein